MCVQAVAWPEPDPQIAAAIAAKYPGKRPRPLAVQVRDRLGEWLADEEFAAAFGIRGRPGWSPSRLALVTILQRAEKLTDRQAAEAVRTRIDWQYLLGLPLDDPGFDHTVPTEFRARVADAGLEQVALDAPRALRRAHTVPGPGTGCPQRLLQDQPGAQPADRLDRIDMLVDRFQRLIELAAKPLAGGYSRHAREPPSASTCQVKEATPALQGETVRIWGRSYA
jgi:Transposase domain (DUF772)